MKEGTIESARGVHLFTRSWHPDGAPRAVVVLVHGFKAHSGLFDWAAEHLADHGLAVYALDLRGHGKSEGQRLFVEKFEDYVSDVEHLVDHAHGANPGLPVFLLGHSAGGVISGAYALEHQKDLAGFICESFAQEVPTPNAVLSAVKAISRVAPRLGVFALKNDYFSRDRTFVERMNHDPLIDRGRYPAQTVAELRRAEELMESAFPRMTLPVLILHGTRDHVTKPHGSQLFYDTAGSTDKTLRLYDGHFHDLLNDRGKEQVLGDVTEWIDAHVPNGSVSPT